MDFDNELYKPLRTSVLNSAHEIILPHEDDRAINTKELIEDSDLVIAEVSESATGVGIELGWADAFGKPIVCISRNDAKPSNSLKYLTANFIKYDGAEDMISKLSDFISKKS